jgi:hypothetical protein
MKNPPAAADFAAVPKKIRRPYICCFGISSSYFF